jgi:hypothetical protein
MYICTYVFSHLLGSFLHILTCTCNYMLWPLALREYNLSIPNTYTIESAHRTRLTKPSLWRGVRRHPKENGLVNRV